MRLDLSRRADPPPLARILAPIGGLAVAALLGALLVAALGRSPAAAFTVFVVEPLSQAWSLQELGVKAAPLVLIAVGLLFPFRASLWNIGAEGQYIVGALAGSSLALATHGTDAGAWVLPTMLLLGALGGLAYALIPALLRVAFGVSEILTSLMLVYVAELGLDYLVRGPWRDPKGFNFPQSVTFDPAATLPALTEGGRLHLGVALAPLACLIAWAVLSRTLFGYHVRLAGIAPRAARFSGVGAKGLIVAAFAISGALAGAAGIVEVSGQIGQLQPQISPGYGFTAIIVAFLGRLHPIGVLLAGLVVALTFVGGEAAQIALKLPLDVTRTFQGLLLMCVLGADALVSYRVRITRRRPARAR